jgi:hypothetical protein
VDMSLDTLQGDWRHYPLFGSLDSIVHNKAQASVNNGKPKFCPIAVAQGITEIVAYGAAGSCGGWGKGAQAHTVWKWLRTARRAPTSKHLTTPSEATC